ncbi:PP2C family protein-serine/threonine phosphatase [Endothiovibrio diazotrophicus]
MNFDRFSQLLASDGISADTRHGDLFRVDGGEEDELLLLDDEEVTPHDSADAWKVLIVDDDEEVHQVTRLVLSDLSFDDRPAQFVSAFSGHQARAMLAEHPDVALVLLDVVMERDDAGLRLVRHIRDELHNANTRIILRTGQPGRAPERHVILHYDINDYREKGELTAQQLYTSVISSLRTYQAIRELEAMNSELEARVEARTHELREANEALARARDRLQLEHDLAKEVFRKAVKPGSLDHPRLRHWRAPMDVVSGDLLLAARRPGGGQYLLMGDFTGHGLSAALGALPIAQLFYRECRRGHDVARIVVALNELLEQSLPTGFFLAACLVEDDGEGHARIWNGGAPDALLLDRDGRVVRRFPSGDLALGIVHSDHLELAIQAIHHGEATRLLLYTDGVIEARNEAGEIFGEERLLAALESEEDAVERVRHHLETFRGDASQTDDITLVELLHPEAAG